MNLSNSNQDLNNHIHTDDQIHSVQTTGWRLIYGRHEIYIIFHILNGNEFIRQRLQYQVLWFSIIRFLILRSIDIHFRWQHLKQSEHDTLWACCKNLWSHIQHLSIIIAVEIDHTHWNCHHWKQHTTRETVPYEKNTWDQGLVNICAIVR